MVTNLVDKKCQLVYTNGFKVLYQISSNSKTEDHENNDRKYK